MTDTDLADDKTLIIERELRDIRYEEIKEELTKTEGATVASVILDLEPGYRFASTDSKLLTAATTYLSTYNQALKDEAAAL